MIRLHVLLFLILTGIFIQFIFITGLSYMAILTLMVLVFVLVDAYFECKLRVIVKKLNRLIDENEFNGNGPFIRSNRPSGPFISIDAQSQAMHFLDVYMSMSINHLKAETESKVNWQKEGF